MGSRASRVAPLPRDSERTSCSGNREEQLDTGARGARVDLCMARRWWGEGVCVWVRVPGVGVLSPAFACGEQQCLPAQLLSLRSRARELQLPKPTHLDPVLSHKRSHCNEKPQTQQRVAHSPKAEKARAQ